MVASLGVDMWGGEDLADGGRCVWARLDKCVWLCLKPEGEDRGPKRYRRLARKKKSRAKLGGGRGR